MQHLPCSAHYTKVMLWAVQVLVLPVSSQMSRPGSQLHWGPAAALLSGKVTQHEDIIEVALPVSVRAGRQSHPILLHVVFVHSMGAGPLSN